MKKQQKKLTVKLIKETQSENRERDNKRNREREERNERERQRQDKRKTIYLLYLKTHPTTERKRRNGIVREEME